MLRYSLCLIMRTVIFLLLFFSAGFSINCSFAPFELASYERVLNCMFSIPFNQTVAAHTAVNLRKAMQLYAFRDIAKAPPAPFAPPVDLDKELSLLETRAFGSDFEFQQSIRQLFLRLHDAHTNYYAPTPYQFTFVLPITVISYAASNTTVLEISDVLHRPEAWNNFNVSELIGAKIVGINGGDALTYVKGFALNGVGLAKDPGEMFCKICFVLLPQLVKTQRCASTLLYYSFHRGVATTARLCRGRGF